MRSAVAGNDRVDLLVVGAGSAGLVAAKTAARLGASVVVVEKARPGGDCLWTGCVPSKALLAAAHRAHAMRDADRFGLQPVRPQVDFAAVMGHVHAAIAALEPPDSPQALRAAGNHSRGGLGPIRRDGHGHGGRARRAVPAGSHRDRG